MMRQADFLFWLLLAGAATTAQANRQRKGNLGGLVFRIIVHALLLSLAFPLIQLIYFLIQMLGVRRYLLHVKYAAYACVCVCLREYWQLGAVTNTFPNVLSRLSNEPYMNQTSFLVLKYNRQVRRSRSLPFS